MKRKKWLIGVLTPVLIATAAFGLWQLGRNALDALIGSPSAPTVPARLVTQINVGVYPVDRDASRSYTDQGDLTRLLRLLRDISSGELAPDAPTPEDAAYFHTITLTYARGSDTICYLLEDYYICLDGDVCYLADPALVAQFHTFLASHPGQAPATNAPAPATEPTVPPSEV